VDIAAVSRFGNGGFTAKDAKGAKKKEEPILGKDQIHRGVAETTWKQEP